MDGKRRVHIKQFIRFNYVGALTVVIGTTVFVLMIFMGFGYIEALVGDYAAGILFSYFMNKSYTFKVKTDGDVVPLVKTTVMYLVSFLLNVYLLRVSTEILGYHVIYSQLVIIFILALFNFLVFKLIIFGAGGEREVS